MNKLTPMRYSMYVNQQTGVVMELKHKMLYSAIRHVLLNINKAELHG